MLCAYFKLAFIVVKLRNEETEGNLASALEQVTIV